jgi:hypothetical protein
MWLIDVYLGHSLQSKHREVEHGECFDDFDGACASLLLRSDDAELYSFGSSAPVLH